ncbi:MAG: hypothetical protein RLZZ591_593 [Pseudomonadota bacterium]|jgi:diguanylate cyclase (GGDEF)-like protein
MVQPLLLVIDDILENVFVLADTLSEDYEIQFATSGLEALQLVQRRKPDLILLDVMMPDMDGYAVCDALKAGSSTRDIPVIFVTAKNDFESETRALKAGAVDFIHKPINQAIVRARVQVHIAIRARERELLELTDKLEKLAQENLRLSFTDGLTGCYNRRHIDLALPTEAERASRYARPLSVIFCDIDHFKKINDKYGHSHGDKVLQEMIQRIRKELRGDIDWVARYGGEEFLVVLPETCLGDAKNIAERLRKIIENQAFECGDGLLLPVTASFGVTQYKDGEGAPAFVSRADSLLYEAKAAGRNRVVSG